MDKNACLLFLYNNFEDCNKLFNICTKLNLNVIFCNQIENINNIISSIKPLFVITDQTNKIVLENIINSLPIETYVFSLSKNLISSNDRFMYVNDLDILEKLIENRCINHENNLLQIKKHENNCYEQIIKELNILSFRSKLVGSKYLTELIYNFFISSNCSKLQCNTVFNEIATKYNIHPSCIERNIRFSILDAYSTSKNKQLFFDISKKMTIPSIKEIANYILDKLKFTVNNNIPIQSQS